VSEFEILTVLTGAAAVVVNVVLFVMVVLQLRAVQRQVKDSESQAFLDNQRRKKQATIDFWAATQDRRLKLSDDLPLDSDQEAIATFLTSIGQGDSDKSRTLTAFLGLYELLAAGINSDVLDLVLFARIAGPRIISVTKGYGAWIDERRTLRNDRLLYDELTTLSDTLNQRLVDGLPY
jgi:hypothetical protein